MESYFFNNLLWKNLKLIADKIIQSEHSYTHHLHAMMNILLYFITYLPLYASLYPCINLSKFSYISKSIIDVSTLSPKYYFIIELYECSTYLKYQCLSNTYVSFIFSLVCGLPFHFSSVSFKVKTFKILMEYIIFLSQLSKCYFKTL